MQKGVHGSSKSATEIIQTKRWQLGRGGVDVPPSPRIGPTLLVRVKFGAANAGPEGLDRVLLTRVTPMVAIL
ncbi:hypothetical protein GCM10009868_31570 [Terrabacter aerolatus]|uniref:Uncharacterized protein n=1 Tax=Terrabacter aerolatus TaxID=422442 RepID=A0A512CYW3_9MICO|nr:hypothetical protein TAE01_12090 [Terrabacter aerolatus]